MEKKHYLEKNMKCVITEDGQITRNQATILNEQTKFYKKLYTSDPKVQFSLRPKAEEKILSEENKKRCEEPLTIDELYDAIMTMKPNKVPGLDGLTVKLYKQYWKMLS